MTETREILDIPLEKIVVHPNQPRTRTDISDLIESVKEVGIVEPITVVPFKDESLKEDGVLYMLVSGHRRLLVSKHLKYPAIPAQVLKATDMKHEKAFLFTLQSLAAANAARRDLTVIEEAGVTQEMLDLGLSIEQIANTTGSDKDSVTALALIAGKLPAKVKKSLAKDTALTLDEADALAEFSDDEDALKQLTAELGNGHFNHTYAQLSRDRKHKQLYAEAAKEMEECGVPIFTGSMWETGAPIPLKELGIKPEDHLECPGHIAIIRVDWQEDKSEVSFACTNSKKYHDLSKPKSEHEIKEAKKAKEGREFRKEGATSTTVRRKWIAEKLKAKTPWKKEFAFLCMCAASRSFSSTKVTFELLGFKPDKNDYGPYYPTDKLVGKNEPVSHTHLIAMACASVDEELRLATDTTGYRAAYAPEYLAFLMTNGYVLSPHEERFLA